VFSLDLDGHWKLLDVHGGAKRVRADPFAALELDLALLWPDEEEARELEEEEEVAAPPPPRSKAKRAPATGKGRRRGRSGSR
jgi:hypothetical protein